VPGTDPLTRLRAICKGFPEVTERPSHGAPTWFVRGRSFLTFWPDGHHDLTFPHLWCAAAPGVQGELITADPGRFFRPPYVGHRGWLGVRMDGADWTEVAEVCQDAYRAIAPATLGRQLDGQPR
jgi:hypothetical protein